MQTKRCPLPVLLLSAALILTGAACVSTGSGVSDQAASGAEMASLPVATVTVHPKESDAILFNPGMGIADFHLGFDHPPAVPEEYPRSTVAYFRWPWAELEPEEGRYAFDFVDGVIAQAKAKGETLAFRILTEYKSGTPTWLLNKGIAGVNLGGPIFPDYNDPTFLAYHDKLIKAFGARYDGSPDIDHIDIGTVGCWGEWNTACCEGEMARQCEQLFPAHDNQIKITDSYFQYFPNTPLVMLHGGQLAYAAARGAGWRADCFGDYGYFGPTWNHMEHAYPHVFADPVIADAWKRGPVQLEVCGVIQEWYDKGFDLERILQKGLEWHVSVLNAKSSPIPAPWRPRIDEYLKQLGYRMVLRELAHPAEARRGQPLLLRSQWDNVGVAPVYHAWPLAYRLRSGAGAVVAQWTSHADLKQWLPGLRHVVEDRVTIPMQVTAGSYALDVAILDQAGRAPYVSVAIDGKRPDGWYPVSSVSIR